METRTLTKGKPAPKYLENYFDFKNETLPDRVIKHFIASGARNRKDQIINMQGVDFTNFKKTKSVLFNHDPGFVIGSCNDIMLVDDRLMCYTRFATDKDSDKVYVWHRDGFINSWSARYTPIESNFEEYFFGDAETWNVDKSELIEYSSSPVPANVDALDIIKNDCDGKLLNYFEMYEIKNNYSLILAENKELKELCNELKTNYEKLTPVDLTEIRNEITEIKNNLPKDVGTVARTLSEYELKDILHNAVSGAVSELTGRKI